VSGAPKVELDFLRIAERLRSADLPPREEVDAVVAIARGGTVPGALVAYRLERPLRLLRLSFRDDANTPQRDAPEPLGTVPDVRGLRVVLVDDVSVSGATLRRARELLGAARTTTVAFKGAPGAADLVLFEDVPSCVRWPWHEDVPTPRPSAPPRAIVLAGVSGAGKTTVGRRLAVRLGWDYVEADDHHPPANVAKMARGEPLSDADREPWLASLRRELDRHLDDGRGVVLSSSALKLCYRRALTGGRPEVAVVMLHGPRRLLAERMAARPGHFFAPRMLDGQLATLELPGPGEPARVVDVAGDPDGIVRRIVDDLGLHEVHDAEAIDRPPSAPLAEPPTDPEPR
jgi:gluconokinase